MRSRCSRRRIVWLNADGDTPSLAAARVKLRSSAMTANAARLPQSSRSISDKLSISHADCTPLSTLSGAHHARQDSRTNFPEGAERTRALAYYAAVAGIGASLGLGLGLGLVLGGILTERISWRVGFFINVPIGIALMLAAQRYFAETERRSGAFDVTGAVTSTFGMTLLVNGIVRSATAGWSDPFTVATITAGVVLVALFVLNEWRTQRPIMPLRLFASRERAGGYAGRFCYLGGMLGSWFFTTQFLQGVIGYSPLQAGVAFLPATLPNWLCSRSRSPWLSC